MNNRSEILTRYHDLVKMIETQFSIVIKMILNWISYYSRQVVFKLLVHILCYIWTLHMCCYLLRFWRLLQWIFNLKRVICRTEKALCSSCGGQEYLHENAKDFEC